MIFPTPHRLFVGGVGCSFCGSSLSLVLRRVMVGNAPEGMRAMRERRQAQDLRELRLVLPDARSAGVRQRVADQVARLHRISEDDALCWIEAVSEVDNTALHESKS